MRHDECGELLRRVAAYDNRKPDPHAVEAWMSVLAPYSYADCLDAVVAHHTESTDWCMPVHIRQRVRKVRNERIASSPTPDPPPDLDVAGYQDWLRRTRAQIADGWTPPAIERGKPIELPDVFRSPE